MTGSGSRRPGRRLLRAVVALAVGLGAAALGSLLAPASAEAQSAPPPCQVRLHLRSTGSLLHTVSAMVVRSTCSDLGLRPGHRLAISDPDGQLGPAQFVDAAVTVDWGGDIHPGTSLTLSAMTRLPAAPPLPAGYSASAVRER